MLQANCCRGRNHRERVPVYEGGNRSFAAVGGLDSRLKTAATNRERCADCEWDGSKLHSGELGLRRPIQRGDGKRTLTIVVDAQKNNCVTYHVKNYLPERAAAIRIPANKTSGEEMPSPLEEDGRLKVRLFLLLPARFGERRR